MNSLDTRRPSTLVHRLLDLVDQRGEHLAFQFLVDGEREGERYGFADLDLRARAIAAALRQRLNAGERVVLLFSPGLETVTGFLGCLYAGVIAIPAPPPDPARLKRSLPRLQAIVQDSGARLVLTAGDMAGIVAQAARKLPEMAAMGMLRVDEVDLALAATWRPELPTPETIAYLQYTSGSTSAPKGVVIRHGNLIANCAANRRAWRYDEDSVSATWMPYFHDYGLVEGLMQSVYSGIPNYVMSPLAFLRRPRRWLQAIGRYHVTHSAAANFGYDQCVERVSPAEREGLDLSSWRTASLGAEVIRAETLERFTEAFDPCGFRRSAFFPSYGLAEATLLVTTRVSDEPTVLTVRAQALEEGRVELAAASREPDGAEVRRVVGCGQAVAGLRVRIVDPATTEPLGEGRIGEVWVAGDSVSSGYWQRDEESRGIFHAHLPGEETPFLRTGDFGFLHDGELFISGRMKELIIIRGANHFPQDVELTVESCHPLLRTNCCAAFSVEAGGEERLVVAVEVERSYREEQLDEIAGIIRQAVAEGHDLEVYSVCLLRRGSILKTSSGKVQRSACRQAFLDGELTLVGEHRAHLPGPAMEAETRKAPSAAGLLEWLLGRLAERVGFAPEAIDPRQPFARHGLDSVAGVRLIAELEQHLGRTLPETLLYEHPTPEAVVRHLVGKAAFQPAQDSAEARGAGGAGAAAEPIAIVGIGCRFPGATGREAFWRLLAEGVDAITEVPAERWSAEAFYDPDPQAPGKTNSRWGGFLDGVDRFDPYFFSISPREAESMDPQQRLLLEVAWEALEDAGQVPQRLAGSAVGVFVGIGLSDYGRWLLEDPAMSNAYAGTGATLSIAANRLSYALDLRGPSLAIDTACSSSLVAVQQACRSLRAGDCHLALAAGSNLLLSPEVTVNFSKAGFLAPDGRCKPFDADANGYVRGEGVGVVVLKPLAAALADGDPVYALIRGGAVNQDGRSNGLTAPNPQAQEEMLRRACADAGVSPGQVQYVEAHGTGTPLGDPIEAGALGAVLGEGRLPETPCRLGSVKSNLGHLEAAAGIAGLIKVALSLSRDQLPPSLHFQRPNPRIDFARLKLAVQTQLTAWPADEGERRLAGLSSFGFGGTNAHLILEGATNTLQPRPATHAAGPRLMPLSAHSRPALRQRCRDLSAWLAETAVCLEDLSYTLSRRRGHLDHRLAVLTSDADSLREALSAFAEGQDDPAVIAGPSGAAGRPTTPVFLFSGHGSQWPAMGQALLEAEPSLTRALEPFRQALEEAFAAISRFVDYSPMAELTAGEGESRLDEIDVAQPLIFALQVALARLWRSWGVEPVAVVGHSFGEVAAAVVSGALEVEDGARIVCHRSRLMKRTRGQGAMLAVDLPAEEAWRLLEDVSGEAGVAVHNSPTSTVLSGDPQVLEQIRVQLEAREVFCRQVRVEVAGHSPQMDPLCQPLHEALEGLQPKASAVPMISTVTGEAIDGESLDAEYWVRNLRQPVRFAEVVGGLMDAGRRLFLEVSPHPVVLAALRQNAAARGAEIVDVGTLRRQEGAQSLLASLGVLYGQGLAIDWSGLAPEHGLCLSLPLYPFQRERLWKDFSRRTGSQASGPGAHPLLGSRFEAARGGEVFWQQVLGDGGEFGPELAFLGDHRLGDTVVLPGTAYAEAALAAAAGELEGASEILEVTGLQLERALFLPEEGCEFQVVALPGDEKPDSLHVEFYARLRMAEGRGAEGRGTENWLRHAVATVAAVAADDGQVPAPLDELRGRCPEELAVADFYAQLEASGNSYGPLHRGIERLWRGRDECVARLRAPAGVVEALPAFRLHPVLLDSAWQSLAALLGETSGPWMPVAVEEVRTFRRPEGGLWSYARLRQGSVETSAETVEGDVWLLDDGGQPVARTRGLRLQRVATPAGKLEEWLYELEWREQPGSTEPTAEARSPQRWLVLRERGEGEDLVGEHLVQRLRADGQPVVVVTAGQIRRGEAEDLRNLLASLDEDAAWGVVFLWGLDGYAVAEPPGLDALVLLRELASWQGQARVWLVSRGVFNPEGGGAVARPMTPATLSQAPLWGLGRAAVQEHPDLLGALVDLPAHGAAADLAAALAEELRQTDGEIQVALRSGRRFVARLARFQPDPADEPGASTLKLRSDASYLVTGGFGGLGLAVARRLVERGARHLLLLGRRPLPPAEEWGSVEDPQTAAVIEQIEALETAGAQVHTVALDVADEEAVEALVESWGKVGRPPIRGVFHAAGVVADSTLAQMDGQTYARVLRPKVAGAWALHRIFEWRPLDFFVLFSSAASLLGSAGQANHSAANAYLDALAAFRRSAGLPASSINWGLWSRIGFAAYSDAGAERRLAAQGIGVIEPEQGLEALERLMIADPVQVGVLPIHWKKLAASDSFFARSPLLRDFLEGLAEQEIGGGPIPGGATVRERLIALAGAAPHEIEARGALLEDYAASLVAGVLKVPLERLDRELPLQQLGLDSLVAVDLKNRVHLDLGVDLPLVRFLAGASCRELAQELERRWSPPAATPAADVPRASQPAEAAELSAAQAEALLARMDELTDEEVAHLLATLPQEAGVQP